MPHRRTMPVYATDLLASLRSLARRVVQAFRR